MAINKTSVSIVEMGKMLGLKKTDSYYLANKNLFEIRVVQGKRRVMLDSFEKWYAGQTHYKKVKEDTDGIDS